MARIGCPSCRNVFETSEAVPGAIIACPGCGLRLQIPGSPPAVVPAPPPAPAPAPPPPLPEARPLHPGGRNGGAPALAEVRVQSINGQEYVLWPCVHCHKQLTTPLGSVGQAVKCPACAQVTSVPRPAPPTPEEPEAMEIVEVQAAVEPEAIPVRRRRAAVEEPPRRREEDDDSWYDRRPRRRSGESYRGDVRSLRTLATAGSVCGMIGLGLSVAALLVLLIAINSHNRSSEGVFIFLLFLFVIGGLVLSLLGLILGAKGMNIANEENRGAGVVGLVLGIIGMVISGGMALFFLFALLVASSRF